MMSTSLIRSQRGTVLVTVLMMFAIAAFLAAEMAYRQRLDVRRTSAMLMSEQAREFLLGAEELSMLALKDDLKADKKHNKFIDGLGEDWALKRPPFPVDGGLIQGEIIDAQSLFNLNDLVDESGSSKSAKANFARDRFKKLCDNLGVPKEGSPQEIYEKIVDWMDPGQDESGPDGREDGAYLSLKRPYRTANRILVDVSELRSIEGMDIETYDKLAPFLVTLPPGTKLNINTAKTELLSAFGVQKQADLVSRRENDPYEQNDIKQFVPDLKTLNGGSTDDDPDNKGNPPTTGGGKLTQKELDDMFSSSSNYFELRAKATLGDRTVYSRSLIYRPGGKDDGSPSDDGNNDKLEVIYRAYVDPLQQPMTPMPNNNNQSE